jgi:peptidoglycan/LPS O-acetylase OafA/YrhL
VEGVEPEDQHSISIDGVGRLARLVAALPLMLPIMTAMMASRMPTRYRSLDAVRGIAALAVAAFHCFNTMVEPGASRLGDAVLAGWAGVYLFFPISGYCILAAVESPRSASLRRFLVRRWRRIFPPYWASIALVVGVALIALPWNHGTAADLVKPPWQWLAIGTLTQHLARVPDDINIVYWSLCFEEQFYLVMAATMLLGARNRRLALLAVSVVGVLYRLPGNGLRPTGLFLERWMEFAVGMAVFDWAEGGARRAWAAALLGLGAATAALGHDPKMVISLAAAVALIALRPVDERLSASRTGRLLGRLGVVSYSLYLVHVPIGGRVVNLIRRVAPAPSWTWPIGAAALAASMGVAVAFHRLVERRFVDARREPVAERIAA